MRLDLSAPKFTQRHLIWLESEKSIFAIIEEADNPDYNFALA
jgi:hypothetical protein